ncbi:uncharacterized protein LOC100836448 isoform X2 [Brachypodium distachyon]|uniref:uncharacterized protein LOC100836448 isoform X2 n=1 Tax=Brachypodium distachyon TaxID=15368 RepID=UPI00052FF30E|nr:uncharacterized protein LOC100836448 isoform X2 [Brachypodium distachyon]XP_010231005.1 uncharacterized protein LOC100836448 isoform X2 [Brachypodium distachyon]XP_010231008.1 uncharacterized protein LOC100836448 isoform X2 [Brachypodium distachyon]XP_024314091.1 uncharacterized protein LOC100836448 isoform X2 [Brachypodium distachyon]|eukprot:XP_003567859.2 uncharacterized protein LOC100836448 isoform X2 [Brachypodium distachyon]
MISGPKWTDRPLSPRQLELRLHGPPPPPSQSSPELRRAMVSWTNTNEEYILYDPPNEPPRWIHMREFAAGAGENVVCHCLCLVKIRVAYEGTDAGRRLLACGFEDGVKCNFYQWLDPEWPGQMQHVLTKMWEEIDELKQSKRHEMHRLNQRNSVMHEQVRLAMQELEQEKKKAEEEKKMVEEEKK